VKKKPSCYYYYPLVWLRRRLESGRGPAQKLDLAVAQGPVLMSASPCSHSVACLGCPPLFPCLSTSVHITDSVASPDIQLYSFSSPDWTAVHLICVLLQARFRPVRPYPIGGKPTSFPARGQRRIPNSGSDKRVHRTHFVFLTYPSRASAVWPTPSALLGMMNSVAVRVEVRPTSQ
jgi:hypothetical protein